MKHTLETLLAPVLFPAAPIAICFIVEHLAPYIENSLPPCFP